MITHFSLKSSVMRADVPRARGVWSVPWAMVAGSGGHSWGLEWAQWPQAWLAIWALWEKAMHGQDIWSGGPWMTSVALEGRM